MTANPSIFAALEALLEKLGFESAFISALAEISGILDESRVEYFCRQLQEIDQRAVAAVNLLEKTVQYSEQPREMQPRRSLIVV